MWLAKETNDQLTVTIVAVEAHSSWPRAPIQGCMSKRRLSMSALGTTSDACHKRYKKEQFHKDGYEVEVRPLNIRQRNQTGCEKKKSVARITVMHSFPLLHQLYHCIIHSSLDSPQTEIWEDHICHAPRPQCTMILVGCHLMRLRNR